MKDHSNTSKKKAAVDFKKLFKAYSDISKRCSDPIAVSIYIDESAPKDLIGLIRSEFATSAENVRITINYVGTAQAVPNPGDDAAIIVAGFNDAVGLLAQQAREAGIPTMVVSTVPAVVADLATASDYPIPDGDLVAPLAAIESEETFVLDDATTRELREQMGMWIGETCSAKLLSFAYALPFVRRPIALEAVSRTAMENAVVGALPVVPGADMPVMTVNQAKMLLQIAAAYGQPINKDRVKEIVAVVANGFVLRSIGRSTLGLVPFVGWAFKGAVGYFGTIAVGRAAIAYFENGGGIAGLGGVVESASKSAMNILAETSKQQGLESDSTHVGTASASSVNNVSCVNSASSVGSAAGLAGFGQSADVVSKVVTAASVIGKTAAPFAKSALSIGSETLVDGIESLRKLR